MEIFMKKDKKIKDQIFILFQFFVHFKLAGSREAVLRIHFHADQDPDPQLCLKALKVQQF